MTFSQALQQQVREWEQSFEHPECQIPAVTLLPALAEAFRRVRVAESLDIAALYIPEIAAVSAEPEFAEEAQAILAQYIQDAIAEPARSWAADCALCRAYSTLTWLRRSFDEPYYLYPVGREALEQVRQRIESALQPDGSIAGATPAEAELVAALLLDPSIIPLSP